jgi:hypothetical protein
MGLLSWLRSAPSVQQVMTIELEEHTFEQRLQRIVTASRGLGNRSEKERQVLIEDVTEALDILDGAIDILNATELAQRAKKTRTRLRTVRTRAQNAA